MKDGVDPDAVEGAAENLYGVPNFHVDYVREEPPGIPTAFWRGVGPTHNIYVVESFVDELAARAGKDPVEYRRALLAKQPRALGVLNKAAEMSGWGTPLGPHKGRGISVMLAFGTYMAQVAEVTVSEKGEVHVDRVFAALDCGVAVNPDTITAQLQSGIIFGITAALHGEVTIEERPRRAVELRQLSDAAHQRGTENRGGDHQELGSSGRHRRAGNDGTDASGLQRRFRRNRRAAEKGADQPDPSHPSLTNRNAQIISGAARQSRRGARSFFGARADSGAEATIYFNPLK